MVLAALAFLLIAAVAFWVLRRPQYIPEFLIIAAYLGLLGLKVSVAGLNLRPNMLVALVSVAWAVRNKSRVPGLALFVAVNVTYLVSTLLHPNSPVFFRGLADCVLLSVNLMQYWIVAKSTNLDRLLRVLFRVSATAFTCLFVLYIAVAAGLMSQLEKAEGDFVRLSLLDPTQGSYILFTLLALIFYLLLFGYPYSKAFTLWCLGAHLAALAFTFARASWLAFALTFLAFWLVCLIRFPLRKTMLGTVLVLLTLVPIGIMGFWNLSSNTGDLLTERARSVSLEEGTVLDRLILWYNMVDDWRKAPFLGHGAHAYAKFRDDPAQISENYTLELLHSGGAITAGLYVVGLSLLIIRAMPISWDDATRRPWSLPLVAGFIGMSVSALANPAMTGGIYWIGAGLLAGLQLCHANRPDSYAVQQS
jgi:hypothetical protein